MSEAQQAPQVDETTWEGNYKLVHLLARKGLATAKRHRLPIEYDDLFQEASIGWMTARKSFNPALGFRFTTYLVKVVKSRLWRILSRDITRQVAMPRKDFLDSDDMLEAIAQCGDDSVSVEEQMMNEEAALEILQQFSPRALAVFRIVQDPPLEVRNEYNAWQEKSKVVNGHGRPPRVGVTTSFVCRVLMPRLYGLTESQGRSIEMEISYVIQSARDL